MSPSPSHILAARIAGRLRAVALLALLLTHISPALAVGPAQAPALAAQLAPAARPAGSALAAAGVTATQVDGLLVDANGNGRADPGDKLRYTVVIDNASGAEIPGLTFDTTLDPSTTLVPGSVRVSPLALPDSYDANRGAVLAIAAPGLLANDSGTPAPAVTAGSVPTAAGGTAALGADGSFSYTPPPSYTGIDSFSYSANNLAGADSATVTLTVRAVPVAADDIYTVVRDSARSIPAPGVLANDTGFPPPSVTSFSGLTSAGGSVTIAANGGFSYSPPAGYTGADSFGYTAVNVAGSDTATVTLTVGLAPLAQNDTGYAANLGAPLSVAAGAGLLQNDTLGSPAATVVSFGGGDLGGTPASNAAGATASFGIGGSLKIGAGGGFDFTPSAGFTGAFSFGYRISNPFGTSDALATIAVQQLPAITSADTITFTVGVTNSFNVATTGFPIPTISQTGTLPNGVTFVDNGDGTATLSGTPAPGSGGSYSLVFSAANSAGSSPPQSFTLLVQQGPAITSATSAAFTVGASGVFTVTASGSPPPAIGQTGTLPNGVTFVDNGDGTATLSGTPAPGSGGSYPLVFSAANSAGLSPPQSFTLLVGELPAITSSDAVTFTVGVNSSFTITASGIPTPTITRGGASLPPGLAFANNGDGTATLSGTPGTGSGGVRTLTFTANSSAGASPAQQFALTIREAPAISSAASAAFEIGASGVFTVTASGYPTPTITSLGALPAGVTFADNGDGTATLAGTPALGSGGSYPLSFSAGNSVGASPAQSFTLIVGQAPAITSPGSVTFTVGLLESFTIATSGFPAAAITQTGALPNGVTFMDNGDGTGTLGGMPALLTEGSYSLTFGAGNLFGSSASQAFTLKVQSAVVRARGGQSAAAPLSVSVGTLPAGKRVTITYDVVIADPLPIGTSRLINQGMVSGGGITAVLTDDPRRPGAADPTITFVGTRRIYLPLLIRVAGPPLPDLVVENITSANGTVSVTIRNDGQAPVVDAFWIDLYIDPTSAPVRANQLWSDVGSRGASWGVVDSALPFAPGARLTVTLGDMFYRPLLSNPGGAIATGTQLYAQVDSYNANNANGAVLETHERDGQAYNNILGPVVAP